MRLPNLLDEVPTGWRSPTWSEAITQSLFDTFFFALKWGVLFLLWQAFVPVVVLGVYDYFVEAGVTLCKV